jgi:superfamily I DNA/RNA helicase
MTSAELGASRREALLTRLGQTIPACSLAVCADGNDRPDLIVVDPARGLVVVEIEATDHDPADRGPMSRLNAKVANLRAGVPVVEKFRPHRLVLYGAHPGSLIHSGATVPPRALGLADLDRGDWLDQLEVRELDPAELEELRSALAPTLAFTLRARRGISDPGRPLRREQQLTLDAQQAVAATVPVDDVLVLSGPPGSGKTLVLAGRAKYLASQHPDWRIVVLCYNNSLVPYLKSLVDDYPNVAVSTFGKFSHALGHRISLDDSERATEDLVWARGRGIDRVIDAVLIDEAQDFDDAWLGFALDTLRPGRGGAVLAGDERQALYRDASRPWALEGRRVAHLRLERTYRSTREILDAAGTTLQGRYNVHGAGTLAGELVDLIWAQSWDEQAAAMAWEISHMIGLGEREPQDIAVLVTQRSGTFKRIQSALDRVNVPYLVVNRENAASFDLRSSEVKIMTVHAAKGYEFDVVVLFGLEALPSPTEDAEAAQRGSVGFVGMTRARDQLLVTYTRDNPYLERLRRCPSVNFSVWPDDFEV